MIFKNVTIKQVITARPYFPKRLSFLFVLTFILSCSPEEELNVESQNTEGTNIAFQKNALTKWADSKGDPGDGSGYFYTIDTDGNMGSASINFSGAVGSGSYPGNFYMQWNNVKQVVGGKGWENSNDRTVGYNVGSVDGPIRFVGVYGWTQWPLTEYYVCEYGPGAVFSKDPVKNNGQDVTYWSNDNQYKLYQHYRGNKPSIAGYTNFWQFESVRVNQNNSINNSNYITMNNHFYRWDQKINTWSNNNQWSRFKFGWKRDWVDGESVTYMVFGAEAYDYSSNSSNVSGSINATIW